MKILLKGERGIIENAPLTIQKKWGQLARAGCKNGTVTFHHCTMNWRLIQEWLPDEPLPDGANLILSQPEWTIEDGLKGEHGYVFGSTPYNHQLLGFLSTRDRPRCGLFMDPGTGKSKVTQDTACYAYARGRVKLHVVVAPNGVQHKWARKEVPFHSPAWAQAVAYSCQTSTLDDALEAVLRNLLTNRFTTLCINAEAISRESVATQLEDLTKQHPVFLTIDESTRFKRLSSARGHQMLNIVRQAEYARILTGSIFTRDAEDVYGQLKLLSEVVAGERTLTGFRARFCETEPRYGRVVGSRNLDELHDEVKKMGFVALKKDCLDLPAKVYKERYVQLTAEQKKHYTNVKDLLCTELEGYVVDRDGVIKHEKTGKLLETDNIMAKMTRLQQIVCGHLIDPDTRQVFELDCTPRFMAVYDILEEMPRKAIVWTRFATEAHRLGDWLHKKGWKPAMYTGRVKPADRQRNLDDFQDNPRGMRVLVGTMAAGGIGLDMTAADTVIYYSNDFDAEKRWQSEDRAHRIGQENKVTYTDLIAPGTIDKYIMNNVKRKEGQANTVKGLSSWLTPEDRNSSEALSRVLARIAGYD